MLCCVVIVERGYTLTWSSEPLIGYLQEVRWAGSRFAARRLKIGQPDHGRSIQDSTIGTVDNALYSMQGSMNAE
jgi:hypothetical protein